MSRSFILEDIYACENAFCLYYCYCYFVWSPLQALNLRQSFDSGIRYISMWDRAAIKLYLRNRRWVFSSPLDLNQTTAKETTSPFSISLLWYFKASFIIYPVSSSLASSVPVSSLLYVFAKGRLRSESRQEYHVIRLWKYMCWNCITTKERGSRKKKQNNFASCIYFIYTFRFSPSTFLPNIKLWMKVWKT